MFFFFFWQIHGIEKTSNKCDQIVRWTMPRKGRIVPWKILILSQIVWCILDIQSGPDQTGPDQTGPDQTVSDR